MTRRPLQALLRLGMARGEGAKSPAPGREEQDGLADMAKVRWPCTWSSLPGPGRAAGLVVVESWKADDGAEETEIHRK